MSARPDPDAYAELTAPFHGRLFEAAFFLCGDRDLAADLAQEALVRGFEAFDRFREGAPPYPWLVTILRHVYLDHVRSAPTRREVALGETMPEPEETRPDPLASLIAAEEADLLRAAIAALPADFAITVTLFDLQGLTYNEVAEATGVSVGTVRSRLSRGRNRLREMLLEKRRLASKLAGEQGGGSWGSRAIPPVSACGTGK